MICETTEMREYLKKDENVDFDDNKIMEKAAELFEGCTGDIEKTKRAFEFVRDKISHSWDIKSTRITKRASEVLDYGEGICYAKSNLLAALLRAADIPAGFCYQRLTLGNTPETGYCLHALNAVFLKEIGKWIRLDSRGNKEGINSMFSIDEEILAFQIRKNYDETDYPVIYANPLKITMDTLKNNNNCIEMYKYGLPDKLN